MDSLCQLDFIIGCGGSGTEKNLWALFLHLHRVDPSNFGPPRLQITHPPLLSHSGNTFHLSYNIQNCNFPHFFLAPLIDKERPKWYSVVMMPFSNTLEADKLVCIVSKHSEFFFPVDWKMRTREAWGNPNGMWVKMNFYPPADDGGLNNPIVYSVQSMSSLRQGVYCPHFSPFSLLWESVFKIFFTDISCHKVGINATFLASDLFSHYVLKKGNWKIKKGDGSILKSAAICLERKTMQIVE